MRLTRGQMGSVIKWMRRLDAHPSLDGDDIRCTIAGSLAAYERVAALLADLDVLAAHGDPPPCPACQCVADRLRRALEGDA